MGIGAPAEFGNATGAVMNVVTKSGSNNFHGNADFYFQFDGLTDENVKVDEATGLVTEDGIPFGRDAYRDFTGSIGGPISKDSLWFFFGVQVKRDLFTNPGAVSEIPSGDSLERYDFKISAQLSEKHKLDALFHQEIFTFDEAVTPFVTADAAGRESGTNPSWKAGLTSVLNDTTLTEINYAGWWGDAPWESLTGSQAEPFIDLDPPGGGPPRSSTGLYYPSDYANWTHQFDAKLTKYAENFLNSQHDFKFGVQLSYGGSKAKTVPGPTGGYAAYYIYAYDYYGYVYEYPYPYRGRSGGLQLGRHRNESRVVPRRLHLDRGSTDRQRGRALRPQCGRPRPLRPAEPRFQ